MNFSENIITHILPFFPHILYNGKLDAPVTLWQEMKYQLWTRG